MRQVKVTRMPGMLDEPFTAQHLASGLSVGAGIGIIAGLAIRNLALGLSVGVGLGLSIGMLISTVKHSRK